MRIHACNRMLLACSTALIVALAEAADVPIEGRKLLLQDKGADGGKLVFKAVLGAGAPVDPGLVGAAGARLIIYDTGDTSNQSTYVLPPGARQRGDRDGWRVRPTTASYVNRDAPSGRTGVKSGVYKPGRLLKVVAKSTGDGAALDLSQPPRGDLQVIFEVGATRFCTRFAADSIRHKPLAAPRVGKLIASGPTGLVPCAPAVCGNGVLDPGETCDDGNATSGDGCSVDCSMAEPRPQIAFVSPDEDAVLEGVVQIEAVATSIAALTSLTVDGIGGAPDEDPAPGRFLATVDAASLASGEIDLVARAEDAGGFRSAAHRRVQVPLLVLPGQPLPPDRAVCLVSDDGQSELVMPPFALEVLARPELTVVPRLEAPPPAFGETIAGAVRGEPAGLTFSTPVTLRFPVEGTLPPGTTLPLKVYDEELRAYVDTGETATVSDSGTHFETSVTHFSLYSTTITGTPPASLDVPSSNPVAAAVAETPIAIPGAPMVVSIPRIASATGVQIELVDVHVIDEFGTDLSDSVGAQIEDEINANADSVPDGDFLFLSPLVSYSGTIELDIQVSNPTGSIDVPLVVEICSPPPAGGRPIFFIPGYGNPGDDFLPRQFPFYTDFQPSPANDVSVWKTLTSLKRPMYRVDLPNVTVDEDNGLVIDDTIVQGCTPVGDECVPDDIAISPERPPGYAIRNWQVKTRGDIPTSAVSMMHQISAVLDKLDDRAGGDYFGCGQRQVDLVTFSTGGAVGRYAAQFLQQGADFRIRNLVTLAGPHGGVSSAAFMVSNVIQFVQTRFGDPVPQQLWRDNPFGILPDTEFLDLVGCPLSTPSCDLIGDIGSLDALPADQQNLPAEAQAILAPLNALDCVFSGIDINPNRPVDDLAFEIRHLVPRLPSLVIPSLPDIVSSFLQQGIDMPTIMPLLDSRPIPVDTRVTTVAGRRFDGSVFDAAAYNAVFVDPVVLQLTDFFGLTCGGARPLDQLLFPMDLDVRRTPLPPAVRSVPWDFTVSNAHMTQSEAPNYARRYTEQFTFHDTIFAPLFPNRYELRPRTCIEAGTYTACDIFGTSGGNDPSLAAQSTRCALKYVLPGASQDLIDDIIAAWQDVLAALSFENRVCESALDLFVGGANTVIGAYNLSLALSGQPLLPLLSEHFTVPHIPLPPLYVPVWSSCEPENVVSSGLGALFGFNSEDDGACNFVLNNADISQVAMGAVDVPNRSYASDLEGLEQDQWNELVKTCLFPDPNPRDPLGNHARIEHYLQSPCPCVNGVSAPAAHAGPDQVVVDLDGDGHETITLDGSSSFEPDAEASITGFTWRDAQGAVVGTEAVVDVTLPAGDHVLTLEVTSDTGGVCSDEVAVQVTSTQLPVANAGPDLTVHDADDDGMEPVALSADGSFDPDGFIAAWDWYEGATLIATGFAPQVTFGIGVHTVTLVVTDNIGATANDEVLVEIVPHTGQLPVADAGPDLVVVDVNRDGVEPVFLSGSSSFDPDGFLTAWEWFEGATLIATGPAPRVFFDVGVHTVTLVVTDNSGATDSDEVTVEVRPPAPVCGNGFVDPDEECDSGVTPTCSDLGYPSGPLPLCRPDCTLEIEPCCATAPTGDFSGDVVSVPPDSRTPFTVILSLEPEPTLNGCDRRGYFVLNSSDSGEFVFQFDVVSTTPDPGPNDLWIVQATSNGGENLTLSGNAVSGSGCIEGSWSWPAAPPPPAGSLHQLDAGQFFACI